MPSFLLVSIVVVLASPLIVFKYLAASYGASLSSARDAWWMRLQAGLGRKFLIFVFERLPRSLMERNMASEGRAKVAEVKAASPPPDGLWFVGSSTFTFWRQLEQDIASEVGVKTPCVNAAFGGSCTAHVLQHVLRPLCTEWKPAAVVYFCGTNDLNWGGSPAAAAQGFTDFCEQFHSALPRCPCVYLSATITPFVRSRGPELVAKYEELNRRVQVFAEDACSRCEGSVLFVDLANETFVGDLSFYLGDQHHLNDAGHTRLARSLAPAIRNALGPAACKQKTLRPAGIG
jgi:lysophospholipase L1-like esterase